MDVVRIPLTITATGSGHETDGVLVAVAVSQLDDLMAETGRLRDLLQTVASTIHEEWSMSYARQLWREIETMSTPESALGCPHFNWQYEGSWSRDGAFYRRRCVRCGRSETVDKDQFFTAIGALAGAGT